MSIFASDLAALVQELEPSRPATQHLSARELADRHSDLSVAMRDALVESLDGWLIEN